MIKVKDGYAKLIGTTYSGSASRVLLSNGGDHVLGNASGNIPLNNGTVNTNLNADMLDGLHIHTGRNSEANKVVRTDANGYILAGWINTTSGDMGTTAATRIYCSNDGYIRYKTPANFFSVLTNSSNLLSITVGDQNRKVTVAYATSSGNSDTLDNYHANSFIFHLKYSSLSALPSGANGWYKVGSISDTSGSACIFVVRTYAHSSAIFTVSKGYSTSGNITVLQYCNSGNGSFAYIKGARLISDGTVEILLNKPSANNSTYVNISVAMYNADNIKPLTALTLDTGSPTVIQTKTFTNDSIAATTFVGNLSGTATNATNVYVNLHTSNNTEYPLVWSNLNNTNSALSNQLYKSYSHLTYNPSAHRISTGLYIANNSSGPHFTANSTAGNWAYLRLHNGSTYWDIATRSTSGSGGLWLARLSGADNGIFVSTGNSVGISTSSPADKLHVNGGYIRSTANSRYLKIGPRNSSHAHYETDADTSHWFNKRVDVNGAIWRYNTNYGIDSDGKFYAHTVYANRSGSGTAGGVSLYSNSDPMTYGIASRNTADYGTHGYVTGDWATYLTMSNTSNRGWIFRTSDGTRRLSINAQGHLYANGLVNADRFNSRVATGTLPYACTSTTLNTNLNADMLDGYHWTSFARWYGDASTDSTAKDVTATSTADFFAKIHATSGLFNSRFGAMRGSWWYVGNTLLNTGVGTLEMAGTAVLNLGSYADTNDTYKSLLFLDQGGRLWSYTANATAVKQWSRYAKTSDIPTVTNYYWANLQVQSASSNTTVPSFGAIRMNGVASAGTNYITGAAGRIYFGGNFHIDSLGSNSTYINHYTANNIYMCTGSSKGKVGIGTTSPSYPLHVAGDSYTTGWSRAGSGFYVHDKGVHFSNNGTHGEIAMTSNNGFNWAASSSSLYFNYNAASRGTTVTNYIWNAGSSSTYASHTLGALTSRGDLTLYGLTQTCNKANNAGYMNSALLIREYNFGGSQSDTWAIAPRLSWHWSGRVQTQIGLNSSGDLKLSKDNFATSYLLLHLGNSSVSGGGSSGGSSITVNIGGTSKTLTIPTSLPANGGTSSYTNYLKVLDIRGTNHLPNSTTYPEKNITAWFNSTGTPDSSWWSGITVKGWTSTYAVWQLCSYSSTGTANNYNLYFRNGINSGWGSWKTILDSSNYKTQIGDGVYWKVNGQTTVGGGDIYLEMWRGANASWKMLNAGGVLKFLSNYTTAAGSYFDCLTITYNSGATWIKGRVTAPGASIGGYNNTSYALSTASFICNSWVRTVGSSGWYNESYGGGWYMTDSSWIRNFNSKPLYLTVSTYPTIVCNSTSGSEVNIRFDRSGTTKGYTGYHDSYGTFLYNAAAGKYVYINSSGYFYTQSYINVGAGNEKNASNPPYVWGVNGSDNFMRTYATSSLSVGYAANADKLDGIHASGLLTAFSYTDMTTAGVAPYYSITIGGTTKTAAISRNVLVRKSYIYSATADLTSYWCKVADITLPYSCADYTATIIATRPYGSTNFVILKWNCRTNCSTTAAPTHDLYYIGTPGLGGSFRSYHSGAGNTTKFELWANGGGRWCGWTFTVVNESPRGGSDMTGATYYRTSFTSVQTPSLSAYIEATWISPKTLTFAAGAFSAKTYNGSTAVTVNVPTHTSHLTNNSGFWTGTRYWANIAVSTSSSTTTTPTFAKVSISNSSYNLMTLTRSGSTNGALMAFANSNGTLGHIGMTGAANGGLYRYSADANSSYLVCDANNSSVSGGGSSWGSSITVKIAGTSKTLTIPANPNTHWTTRIYAGASGTAANAAATNPYLKVTDNNTYRNLVRFVGGGATTVSSDASGNITISSTNTTYSFAAKGSATQGIYLSGTNTFATMTYSLKATVNAGTASKLAYYSGANAISAYTSTVGSSVLPIYMNAGVPTACNVPMVRYWARYTVTLGGSSSYCKYTKYGGNHNFITAITYSSGGKVNLTCSIPSGWSSYQTMIFSNGFTRTSSSGSTVTNTAIYPTIYIASNFTRSGTVTLYAANDSTTDYGTVWLHFLCIS